MELILLPYKDTFIFIINNHNFFIALQIVGDKYHNIRVAHFTDDKLMLIAAILY